MNLEEFVRADRFRQEALRAETEETNRARATANRRHQWWSILTRGRLLPIVAGEEANAYLNAADDEGRLSSDAQCLTIDGLTFSLVPNSDYPQQVFECPRCHRPVSAFGDQIVAPSNVVLPGEPNGATRPCVDCQQEIAEARSAQHRATPPPPTLAEQLYALVRDIAEEVISERLPAE